MIKSILIIPILLIVLSACYYDNEEELYPDYGKVCDTTIITYDSQISEFINNQCISCHGASVAPTLGGGIGLYNYDLVSDKADAVYGAISHSGGYSAMPKGSSKLDECTIAKMEIWIRNGKPR